MGFIILKQRQTPSVYAAQRRPQIVRHRISEGLQLSVGGFEIERALVYALLEFGVNPKHLELRLFALGDIDICADQALRLSAVILEDPGSAKQPMRRAVRPDHPPFGFE